MEGTEATISWDVSGYYAYLPATLIYKDLKQCEFATEIVKKYNPSPNFPQGIESENGNHVMKYTSGQAINFLPAFLLAHTFASISDKYESDGFDRPYQLAISLWSLVIAFIGLLFLLKVLIHFFPQKHIASATLVLLVLGTNYLDYASITGAMTHNYLFTIHAIILYCTIQLYRTYQPKYFIMLGLLIGLATLTRPTEILICLIPVLWPPTRKPGEYFHLKFEFFRRYRFYILISIAITLFIGSIQLFYWKYVSGEWLVYSYDDQGFSWLRPHIMDGLFSYQSGWLVYSPLMILALFGFIPLYQKSRFLFWPVLFFIVLFIYVTFAWDIWWYGGSLGQRAMVQSYPILALPLASLVAWLSDRSIWLKAFLGMFIIVSIYLNFWFTHQAHRGGLLHAGAMTKAYFWKTLGTYEKNPDDVKLLDTDEYIREEIIDQILLWDTTFAGVSGTFELNDRIQHSPVFTIPLTGIKGEWIRITVDITCEEKEWNKWQMTQLIGAYYNQGESVKSRMIRIQRLCEWGERKVVFLDIKRPEQHHDHIKVRLWHAGSKTKLGVHRIWVEAGSVTSN